MDKCVIDAMKLQQRAIAQKLKYWSGGKNYVAVVLLLSALVVSLSFTF